jgi:hypothetical protein
MHVGNGAFPQFWQSPGFTIAPVLLGDGIRLFDNPGGVPVRLELLNDDDPSAVENVRYHPIAAW